MILIKWILIYVNFFFTDGFFAGETTMATVETEELFDCTVEQFYELLTDYESYGDFKKLFKNK